MATSTRLALAGAVLAASAIGGAVALSGPDEVPRAEAVAEEAPPVRLALIRKGVVENEIVVGDETAFRKSADAFLSTFDNVVTIDGKMECPPIGSSFDGVSFKPPPTPPPNERDALLEEVTTLSGLMVGFRDGDVGLEKVNSALAAAMSEASKLKR